MPEDFRSGRQIHRTGTLHSFHATISWQLSQKKSNSPLLFGERKQETNSQQQQYELRTSTLNQQLKTNQFLKKDYVGQYIVFAYVYATYLLTTSLIRLPTGGVKTNYVDAGSFRPNMDTYQYQYFMPEYLKHRR